MANRASNPGQFTGRHMLLLMLAFFGVIITVNVTMAVFASTSWSGLIVKNSYVASQKFNAKAAEGRAQAALGWQGRLEIADGAIRYRLVDGDGRALPLGTVTASFRRPVSVDDDRTVTLAAQDRTLHAAAERLGDGVWIAEILSDAGLERPYRDVRRIVIREGRLQ
ncbi:FixH family protein [Aquibium sp. A9E412]|uniref:FixH family protein n=1 Tax=Aquibium sp. A9E412 TaxID=2976767 RepID=UPI0025B269D5|nr:FixH family protein [Aquibium sp. A9E412]MDN2567583.1 FixH family protein [Aquibium sp. A9E412]